MSTSLVGTNAYGPQCFVSTACSRVDIVSSRLRSGDARFFSWSVHACWRLQWSELLRGADHGLGVVARRLQCRTKFASFFSCMLSSQALGGPLVNSFRFSTVCWTDIGLSGSKERTQKIRFTSKFPAIHFPSQIPDSIGQSSEDQFLLLSGSKLSAYSYSKREW